MNLIQKFIRKNVNDVLKEGEVYTIKKDELCYLVHSTIKLKNEACRFQMEINSMRDMIANNRTDENVLDKLDYRLERLKIDMELHESYIKDFDALLPNPYKENPREV